MSEQTVTYKYIRPTITSTFKLRAILGIAYGFFVVLIVIYPISVASKNDTSIGNVEFLTVFVVTVLCGGIIYSFGVMMRNLIVRRQLMKDLRTAMKSQLGFTTVTLNKPEADDQWYQYDAMSPNGPSEHGRLVEHPEGKYVLVNLGPQSAGF